MITHLEKIYDDYRKADFIGRLHIYLQFPELRNDFIEIDQNELKIDFFGTTNQKDDRRRRVRKFVSRGVSFLLG